MQAGTFAAYVGAAITGYAEENIAAGRWPPVGAVERSRAEFESLLPQGLGTPDNFLFEIVEEENGPIVGYVWYALERKHGSCGAYIYDLEVKPEKRRQGHAYRALKALEPLAVKAGATSIGLNVFASNVGAQALYRRLGYEPTNFNMYKPLPEA
jgi:ribosomal protein S18 acetylase RimI-like enzyme